MSAFSSLKKFFKPNDITIALPSDPFIVIDRERAIEKLALDEKAQRNGSCNFPSKDAGNYDDVELEIIAEIGEHAARAQIDAANHHRAYSERISELALLRELSSITGESQLALGNYQTTIINRQGRLSLAKDAIRESYLELADFKKEHRLARPAHRGLHPVYVWSAIAISWILESLFNTAFLRVNDEFGLIGGFVAAAVVAAVNVFISALVGRFWWPYLFYRDAFQRNFAIAGTAIWAIGLVVWNLLAGHFRDAKASGLPLPEEAALQLFLNSPVLFDSIYSYGLLIAGMAFAVLSAAAAYKMDDPYPGYGEIYRRHEDRCEAYADEIEASLEELQETRDEAIEAANAVREELGAQFRERGQIIAARNNHRNRYREHQDYLETVGNSLLAYYRSANQRARTDQLLPAHYNTKWVMERASLPLDPDEPLIDDEVARAQLALEQSISTIANAYTEAIQRFEHLDQIKRSLGDG